MKLLALALLLAPVALHAQTDTMPPETKAPMQAMPAKAPVPPSKFLALSYDGKVINLTLTDLVNMPATTVHVHNAHTKTDETYSGPLLSDVLAKIGLRSTPETHSIILHSTIVATGTDHYFVLYSGAEVQPDFSTGKVIVAIMKSDLPDTEGGLIQLINTADSKPARWVHGLASINVMTITASK